MTTFERLCKEMEITITTDKNGFYTGHCGALSSIVTSVILSDNDAVFSLDWESQKEIIKNEFYKTYPYLKK